MDMMSKTAKGVFHVLGKGQKTKHPAQPIAKLKAPDARRVLPKGFSKLSKFYFRKEVNKMAFFATAITGVNCE